MHKLPLKRSSQSSLCLLWEPPRCLSVICDTKRHSVHGRAIWSEWKVEGKENKMSSSWMSAINSPSQLSQWTARHLCAHFKRKTNLKLLRLEIDWIFEFMAAFQFEIMHSRVNLLNKYLKSTMGCLNKLSHQRQPNLPRHSGISKFLRLQSESEDNKIDFTAFYVQNHWLLFAFDKQMLLKRASLYE